MKHLIITAIVSLGLVAQSGIVSVDQQANTGQAIAAVGSGAGGGSQQLSAQETRSAIGGENLTGCWGYLDLLGDMHEICCLDVWIFKICIDLNVSAAERLIKSLI